MNDIIIEVGYEGVRVAVLEEDDLVELYIEREDNKRILGNVYKGKVVNVLPGMQAAFVDIGLEKNAFLYVKDAIPKEILEDNDINIKDLHINSLVKTGQEIIVQVTKEAYGNKGARITTHITLPGRYLVLMPYTNHIGISRRIINENERDRLREIIGEIRENEMGIILRTASEGKSKDDFLQDLNFLKSVNKKLDIERNLGKAPRIVFKDLDLIQRTIRDLFTKNTNKIIINSTEKYKEISEFVNLISSSLVDRIEIFNEEDIFEHFGIDNMIKKALDKRVWLKSGGYIIIDETEALTSIDVNTGKYVGSVDLEHTVVKTNLEAAKEIAKQLRLRNIGGIIIIDFIDMNKEEDIKLVLQTLEKELEKDRIRTTVLGITKLGLVEMTRKKNRKRLSSQILHKCPNCNGSGKIYSTELILDSIEKIVKRTSVHTNVESILLNLNPLVFKNINNYYFQNITDIENMYDIKVFLNPDDGIKYNEVLMNSLGKEEEIKKIISKR